MRKTAILLSAVLFGTGLFAQTVQVKDTVIVTYPYSEPDPVPNPGKLYPYWRFRQFTTEPVKQEWKMVVLENEWLRVKIFPQIGGKVWSIYDKTSGEEMFYDNDVVKFREIALRGPWTSGGIEFNYGVIGHAPSCSSPVDWKTETKEDGSVSCYIGVSDLLSRSRWTIEVNLPKDAVWVRTSSVWHNGSSEYQPYYSWANSAVKASDDLMLVYPADNAIGHGGEKETYPIDEKGNDFRFYPNQAYGADKSYHMVGSHKPFFGAYYTSEDRGVLHYALRDEKLGRKYFCWAQSDQGNIWVDLLTDSRPQYVEMQSGRLFNQNDMQSSEESAYRQFVFTPYGTDRWSDYWLPFSGIGPADDVNLHCVVSAGENGEMGIYPLRKISGEMVVTDASGTVLKKEKVSLSPAKPVTMALKGSPARITVGGKTIWRLDDGRIDRPQEWNKEFSTESLKAKLLMARDCIGTKRYADAEKLVDEVLSAEPGNVDALSLKSYLLFRRMDYKAAYDYSTKALAVDQYNPEAGYFGGLAATELGKLNDALDRFEVAAIPDSPLRTAIYTELSKSHFREGNPELAAEYARKALNCNGDNVTAACILCKTGDLQEDAVAKIDPLNHFPDAEKLLRGDMRAKAFGASFKEEMPWQEYLELAVFYNSLGLKDDARKVLEALPEKNILTELWCAWLADDSAKIAKAAKASADFVFPFRRESAPVLDWAVANGGGWKAEYLKAMLLDNMGYKAEAAALMTSEDTGYAPYYAYRYKFTGDVGDLRKAYSIHPEGWLYLRNLANGLLKTGASGEVISLLEPYYAAHPDVMQIGDVLVDAYLAEGRYEDADKIMDVIVYLPFEGQRGSHDKYRHIKDVLAALAIDSGDLDKAERLVDEALLWPARLGTGKPYDDLIDTTTEDMLKKEIELRRKGDGPFEAVAPRFGTFTNKDKKLF